MAFIYKITNKINNKIYIGKTEHSDATHRWKEHIQDSKRERNKNRPLYKAFTKYGIHNFSFEVLEEVLDNAEKREEELIKLYDSYSKGYNATKGGDGRKRITNQNEVVEYVLNNPKKSIKDIAEKFSYCKETISKILKDNNIKLRANRTLCKEVCQYSKQGVLLNTFETARDAATSLGDVQLNAHINSCCNNKRKTCKGFIWKFKS